MSGNKIMYLVNLVSFLQIKKSITSCWFKRKLTSIFLGQLFLENFSLDKSNLNVKWNRVRRNSRNFSKMWSIFIKKNL